MAPLMPAIEKDLGLSHGEAGSLFLLISSGYFITLIGSGFLSSRLMHKKTIVISAATVGAALLYIAMSNSLWGIRSGLLMLGMGAGLYLPSGIATLTSLISPRHWGKAIAIHELAPNLGFVASPLIAEAFLTRFPWKVVLAFIGMLSIITAIAFSRFGKGGEFQGVALSFKSTKKLFAEPGFFIIMVLFSLGIGASLGLYTMLPLYLITERGLNRSFANILIALSRIPGPALAFLAGWASDRFGPIKITGIIFIFTALSTAMLGIMPGAWIIVFIFLQPTIAVCFFPAGFAVLSSIGPSNARNVAISVTIPVAFMFGGGALPLGLGIMGDKGSFALGIVILSVLIFFGFILSLFLKIHVDQN